MGQETFDDSEEKVQLTPDEIAAMQKRVERAEKMANLLDKKLLDPILGLFDGVGDSAAAVGGAYIIYEAERLGMPPAELARMVGRTTLDTVLGSIPILGSIFDGLYKSNRANAEALRAYFEKIRDEAAAADDTANTPKKDGEVLGESEDDMKMAA